MVPKGLSASLKRVKLKRNYLRYHSQLQFFIVLVAVMFLISIPALAAQSEDSDLDFIPKTKEFKTAKPKVVKRSPFRSTMYIEQTGTAIQNRSDLDVPLPANTGTRTDAYANSALDFLFEWKMSNEWKFNFSDRLDYIYYWQSDQDYYEAKSTLRETYLSWNPSPNWFFDLGRINFKNGVAIGFNPNDYFKKNSVNTELNQDLEVLRAQRMGALMLRSSFLTKWAAFTLAFAPKINTNSGTTMANQKNFGMYFNQTNATDHLLAKLGFTIADNFTTEFLYDRQDRLNTYGSNITLGLGQSVLLYAEWSGAQQKSLAARSTANDLDQYYPNQPTLAVNYSADESFYSQSAVGMSVAWTSSDTTYLEYHMNQAGFSTADWKQWYDAGESAGAKQNSSPIVANTQLAQLWNIRNYARNNQEPMSTNSIFLRNNYSYGRDQDFNFSQILDFNVGDQSFFIQLMGEYKFIKNFIGSAIFSANMGAYRSEYGSLPRQQEGRLGLKYYF